MKTTASNKRLTQASPRWQSSYKPASPSSRATTTHTRAVGGAYNPVSGGNGGTARPYENRRGGVYRIKPEGARELPAYQGNPNPNPNPNPKPEA